MEIFKLNVEWLYSSRWMDTADKRVKLMKLLEESQRGLWFYIKMSELRACKLCRPQVSSCVYDVMSFMFLQACLFETCNTPPSLPALQARTAYMITQGTYAQFSCCSTFSWSLMLGSRNTVLECESFFTLGIKSSEPSPLFRSFSSCIFIWLPDICRTETRFQCFCVQVSISVIP